MKCHACAADISGDARICPVCGADVTAAPIVADPLAEFLGKAKAVGKEAMETDIAKDARQLAEEAIAASRRALASETGKSAAKFAGDAVDAGKGAITTKMGKEMAVGAAIGAVIAIPVPLIGPILGALAGAGIAWYRAKKRDS